MRVLIPPCRALLFWSTALLAVHSLAVNGLPPPAAAPVGAPPLVDPPQQIASTGWEVEGSSLSHDQQAGYYTFEGEVSARSAAGILINADSARMSPGNQSGVFENVAVYNTQDNTYIRAAKAMVHSENLITFEGVSFTNCKPEDIVWRIDSSSFVYQADSYAYGYHGVYYLKSVPLFYLPIYGVPTVNTRRSGLLAPRYEYSSQYEHRLQLPYFWAIDQEHDLTITADYLGRRGLGWDLDYRYAFTPGMYGELRYWFLDEYRARKSTEEHLMPADADAGPQRTSLRFNHQQQAWWGTTLHLNALSNSDNEVRNDYLGAQVNKDYSQRLSATLSKGFAGGRLSVFTEKKSLFLNPGSRYSQETDELTTLNYQPRITLSYNLRHLKAYAGQTRFSGIIDKLSRQQGWRGNRQIVKTSTSLVYPFVYFKVLPSIGYTHLFYQADYAGAENQATFTPQNTFNFGYFESSIEVNMTIYRDFSPMVPPPAAPESSALGSAPPRLSIMPRIILDWRGDVDQRDTLALTPQNHSLSGTLADYTTFDTKYDGYDRILAKNILKLRLDFSYDQSHQSLWRASIIDAYDLNRKTSAEATEAAFRGPQIEEQYREIPYGKKRLPLRLIAHYSPTNALTISGNLRRDHKSGKVLEHNTSINAKGANKHNYASAEYKVNDLAYKNPDGKLFAAGDSLLLKGGLALWKDWRLSTSARWNFARSDLDDPLTVDRTLTEASLKLIQEHCCYKLSFEYGERIKKATFDSLYQEYIDRYFLITFSFLEADVQSNTTFAPQTAQ